MSKTIGVFFGDPGKLDYPFNKAMYYESYRDFTAFCAERGVDLVIVRGATSYLGSMHFSHGWRFVGDELREITEPLTVDCIYNKELAHGLRTDPGDVVVNDPLFDRIARDKWLTYQAFPGLMPPTYRIDADTWQLVFDQIETDTVVLKPVAGTEGVGIIVQDKTTIDLPSLGLTEPYIAQPFVESSGGIPGLCEGRHDLRVIVFGGRPTLAFLRMPRPGGVVSNLSQGGSARVVELTDVPTQIMESVRQIDDHYRSYRSRIYTADFLMKDGRAYLIETNTRPGFPHPDVHGQAFTQTFYTGLLEVLSAALSQSRQR